MTLSCRLPQKVVHTIGHVLHHQQGAFLLNAGAQEHDDVRAVTGSQCCNLLDKELLLSAVPAVYHLHRYGAEAAKIALVHLQPHLLTQADPERVVQISFIFDDGCCLLRAEQ